MKAFVLVSAVALAMTGCSGGSSTQDSAPGAPSVSLDLSTPAAERPSATPALGYEVIAAQPVLTAEVLATLPVQYGGPQRLAICGRHLAYVEGQSQIVYRNWRTDTSRTVFSTDHSFLYAVRRPYCRLDVFDTVNGYNGEDPSEPGRTLSLDLRTGKLRKIQPLPVGEVEVPSPATTSPTFLAWAYRGRVFARPVEGGETIRLPGRIASTGGWPVADGDLVTYTVRDHGWTRIRVVRVTSS